MVWRAWKWTSTSSLASRVNNSECNSTTGVSFGDYTKEHIPPPLKHL
jgi:hypothetical protein